MTDPSKAKAHPADKILNLAVDAQRMAIHPPLRKAKASCPMCGESNWQWLPSIQEDICFGKGAKFCGLVRGLVPHVRAAMECVKIVDDSTLNPCVPKETRAARRGLVRKALGGRRS